MKSIDLYRTNFHLMFSYKLTNITAKENYVTWWETIVRGNVTPMHLTPKTEFKSDVSAGVYEFHYTPQSV